MRRRFNKTLCSESGSSLLLVIILVAMMGLLIVPSLRLAYTGAKASGIYEESIIERYSAGGGIEHVIGRMMYEAGFADSIDESMPVLYYQVIVNSRDVAMTVQYVDHGSGAAPYSDPSGRIRVSKVANPPNGVPGEQLTITYTIIVENIGTSSVHLVEVGDLLPKFPSVQYVSGSSSGISSSNPQTSWVNGRLQLIWPLGTNPGYKTRAGRTYTQQFQVIATIGWDTYLNIAWVEASPNSIGKVYWDTGETAPVTGARLYDITAVTGNATVRARVGLTEDSTVSIISWQNL